MTRFCPTCGHEQPDQATFCGDCGRQLPPLSGSGAQFAPTMPSTPQPGPDNREQSATSGAFWLPPTPLAGPTLSSPSTPLGPQGYTPSMPTMPGSSQGTAPTTPSMPGGPQTGAPTVPGTAAGAQSGTLASQAATSAASTVGKVVGQSLLTKLLGVATFKVVAIALTAVVVTTGSVAAVAIVRNQSSTTLVSPTPTATAIIPAQSATVTITPASKRLQNTFTLSGVTGTPDPAQQQVGARVISVTTPTPPASKTVPATGQATSQGTHATGALTMINYGAATITLFAGTSFPNNQGSGPAISITIDATITLDYGSPGTVAAHVVQVGTIGNITPNSFNSCYQGSCLVFLYNASAFTGGVDPQTYPVVQQSDIDSAANALISANQPDPQQTIQPQIQANEQLVGTPQCTPNVNANHQAGDQAAQVTVSVTFTCTGEVYDHDGALTLAGMLLMKQAATDPGTGYALVGQIKTVISNATLGAQGTITIMVSADGVWAYQFSATQQQALAQSIANKSKQEAMQVLLAQPGVANVSIQLSGGNSPILPTDPGKITFVIEMVPGA